MPVSKEKREEVARRRKVMAELFKLGLSMREIKTSTEVGRNSARNDLANMGGKKEFPALQVNLIERHEVAYKNALRAFAAMYVSKTEPTDLGDVFEALCKFLDIPTLKWIAKGIEETLKCQIFPADPPKYRPYRKLLKTMFGFLEKGDEPWVFSEYMCHLAIPEIILPNRQGTASDMAIWALNKYKGHFSAPLSEHIVKAVSDALSTLDQRQREIIEMRFGLMDRQEKTLDEIGEHFNLTGERIRQLEAKTLRQLRTKSRLIKVFTQAPEKNMADYVNAIFPSSSMTTEQLRNCEIIEVPWNFLDLEIEELEISVRTYHCLKNAYIKTVSDLVKITERELMRIKNFGKGSLYELKELIYQNDLCFGMKMSPEGKLVCPHGHNAHNKL